MNRGRPMLPTRDERRRESASVHLAGVALLALGLGMLVCTAVELGSQGPKVGELFLASGLVAGVGAVLRRTWQVPARPTPKEQFTAAVTTWFVAIVAGAVPYLLLGAVPTVDDALFESTSGFTGFGGSILADIDGQPRGLLFWRQMTTFYGGMGMIVLAVAVLPLLGVGGMGLFGAEAAGPTVDRLSPRISATARHLWSIYAGITVAVALALLGAGLSPFDAVGHAFSTVATAGFSSYGASVHHFDSVLVEAIVIVGMVVGGASFTLHAAALRGDVRAYWRSRELRAYLAVLAGATVVITTLNAVDGMAFGRALRDSAFYAVSIGTSTGFGSVDYTAWVPGTQVVLLLLMLVGGMTGSTAGGLKTVRVLVMTRVVGREVKRTEHPRGVFPVLLGESALPEPVVRRIIAFSLLYGLVAVIGITALTVFGGSLVDAVGAALSALGCTGPGLGGAGPAGNYLAFPRPARAVVAALTLFGRLEIVPLLLVISRVTSAWRPGRLRPRPWSNRRRPTSTAATAVPARGTRSG
jgi:trk system potassium uptake protein